MQKGLVFEDVVAVVGDNGSSFITVILVHLRSSSLFLRFTCVVWLCGGVTESTKGILGQMDRTPFSDARTTICQVNQQQHADKARNELTQQQRR